MIKNDWTLKDFETAHAYFLKVLNKKPQPAPLISDFKDINKLVIVNSKKNEVKK